MPRAVSSRRHGRRNRRQFCYILLHRGSRIKLITRLFYRFISLSGKRVCDSPSIRVSEISVYFENRWVVPMLGKDLFTLHFAKA